MSESRTRGFEASENSPIEVERIDPTLAALGWQNFLKVLSQGISEFDARATLLRRLELESTEAALKKPRVDAQTTALLDSDVERSVSELKAYLANTLRPQNSYLVVTPSQGLNNQRVAEVTDLQWRQLSDAERNDSMAELNSLEAENIRLYYELRGLIEYGLSDDDKRQRLEACQEQMNETVVTVRETNNLSKTDPNQLAKACLVLRAANERLTQIKMVVDKILKERP